LAETTQIEIKTTQAGGLPHWLSWLRSHFLWLPLIALYTVVLGTVSLLCSLFDRSGRVQHGIARLWARMILWTVGAKVRVEGLEHFDFTTPRVYVVNHLSLVDTPVLYHHLPFHFRILAKRELFSYWFMGWHLRRSGQIPVDLENARASIRSLNRAVETLRNNLSLVVFPEGGRSPDGELQPFMGGAFYAAIKAQVEVVPVALVGTYEVMSMHSLHARPGHVRLIAGKPIATKGMSVREMEHLSQHARDAIAEIYYSTIQAVPAK
jgi:1-acyl-sn-glycerol-3-phosphate acyltransferase